MYTKHEELHKRRATQMSKQVEYIELHHVSSTTGYADIHQIQYATHRHNNKTFH